MVLAVEKVELSLGFELTTKCVLTTRLIALFFYYLLIFLKRIAVSVVVKLLSSMIPACFSHLSHLLSVI